MKKEFSVNWIFYLCCFVLLGLFNLFLSYNSNLDLSLKIYAFCYGTLQSFVEILLIVGMGHWIHKKFPLWVYHFFIGSIFIFLLIHFINTILVRMVDSHFDYAWNIFFSGSYQHFLSSIRSLDVNPLFVALVFSAFVVVPLLGIGFYRIFHRRRKNFSSSRYYMMLFSCVCALFLFDLATIHNWSPNLIRRFQRILPFTKSFVSHLGPIVHLKQVLKPSLDEKGLRAQLPPLQLQYTTNIYLFVVEAFRKDHIQQKITPHLFALSQKNLCETGISSANSTHQSWYSIFHSNYPFYWKTTKSDWKNGGLPLQMLKNAGYKIRVYASTDLKYFAMDQLLFGTNTQLLEAYHDFSLQTSLSPAERDKLAIEKLKEDILKHREKNVFITFIDSTHSNYNWTEDFPVKFKPIADPINYLEISTFRNSLDSIKNRYKNACRFVDFLLRDTFTHLKKHNLYDTALICVTGDHGEEFYEEGAIFHGTHLNRYQTQIPIIFQIPKPKISKKVSYAGHVDIFPTLIYYLTGKEFSWLHGQSILSKNYTPAIVTAAHNGNATPYQFSFFNGRYKLTAQFSSTNRVFKDPYFEILSLEDEKGNVINLPKKILLELLKEEFSEIFKRLETSPN